jgi:hypothetical protein
MRTSVLSRSVIAVASLAIASVALAATPATAATPTGITRDMVLTAASGSRIPEDQSYSPATNAALTAMAVAQCKPAAGESVIGASGTPVASPGSADGVLVFAAIDTGKVDEEFTPIWRYCEFGAVAAVDSTFALSGSSSIVGSIDDAPITFAAPLSGDVAATQPIGGEETYSLDTTFSAAGATVKTTTTQVDKKVADKKTKSQKKAAKKTYQKRLKAAKKSYTKALDKAGRNKSKKAVAKKAYAKKRAAVKAAYKKATSPFKIVRTVVTNVDNRPFNVVVVDNTSSS